MITAAKDRKSATTVAATTLYPTSSSAIVFDMVGDLSGVLAVLFETGGSQCQVQY
jgi:hypothetical protein